MKMLVVALCLRLLLPEVSFAADSYQMTAISTVKILTDLKSNKQKQVNQEVSIKWMA